MKTENESSQNIPHPVNIMCIYGGTKGYNMSMITEKKAF